MLAYRHATNTMLKIDLYIYADDNCSQGRNLLDEAGFFDDYCEEQR